MPRRVLVSLLAALLSAATVAGVALAHGNSSGGARTVTITAIELPVQTTFTDLNDKGATQGDTFAASNTLHSGGQVIGRQDDWCTLLNAKRLRFACDSTVFLQGGSIMLQGPFQVGGSARLAIVGGTGRYRDVRGQAIATDLGNE